MNLLNKKVTITTGAALLLLTLGTLSSQDKGEGFSKAGIELIRNTVLKAQGYLGLKQAAAFASTYPKNVPYVPGEVLVKFKESAGVSVQEYSLSGTGHKLTESITNKGLSRISVAEGVSVSEAIEQLKGRPDVEYVQPNFIYWKSSVPNDAGYGQLWGLKNTAQTIAGGGYSSAATSGDDIDAESAWDVNTDCTSTVVAIVDSGVNYNHEDLSANMWDGTSCVSETGAVLGSCTHGYDYVSNDKIPMDLNGHGTHVSGTIAAAGNNSIGSTGICWSARLMAVRVLDSAGSGTTANIVKGVNFALRNGAKVINMSLGGSQFDSAFSSAITTGGSTYDALFVVAAGNETNDLKTGSSYPCKYSAANILCVAALDQAYGLASFSNFDTTATASSRVVDVGAPGTNIRSSWAGTEAVLTDDFNSSGTLDWTNSVAGGSSWGYKASCALGGSIGTISNILAMSSAATCSQVFGAPLGINNNVDGYLASTNTMVYKSFSVPNTYEGVSVNFTGVFDIEYNLSTGAPIDTFHVWHKAATGNPISGGSAVLSSFSYFGVFPWSLALPSCSNSSTCTVGFWFTSNGNTNWGGIALIDFYLSLMDTDTINAYNVIDGTSMASPHVAGLATLLRAYNPNFTYQDTIDAIVNGGEAASSISSNTKYGVSINANNSIRFLKAPTGVAATLQ